MSPYLNTYSFLHNAWMGFISRTFQRLQYFQCLAQIPSHCMAKNMVTSAHKGCLTSACICQGHTKIPGFILHCICECREKNTGYVTKYRPTLHQSVYNNELSCVHSPLQLRCGKFKWSYFRFCTDYYIARK